MPGCPAYGASATVQLPMGGIAVVPLRPVAVPTPHIRPRPWWPGRSGTGLAGPPPLLTSETAQGQQAEKKVSLHVVSGDLRGKDLLDRVAHLRVLEAIMC
eukprot:5986544-Pyramimonas_sp.AAC.2